MPYATSNKPPVQPTVTAAHTDVTWDTFISASGYTVTPEWVAGEESVIAETLIMTTVMFLWSFAWYHFDGDWNYLGEEYLEVPDPQETERMTRSSRRLKSAGEPVTTASGRPALDLVDGADLGGHFAPDRGGMPSKHRRALVYVPGQTDPQPQPLGGCYNNFLGQDLDQDATTWYFPAPDLLSPASLSPLEFRRMWHDGEGTSSVGLPAGWFHNWDVRLVEVVPHKQIRVVLPGNREWVLDVGRPAYGAVVTPGKTGGSYVLTWTGAPGIGTTWEFDLPAHAADTELRLSRVRHPSGLDRRLLWDGSSGKTQLRHVSDMGGAKLVLDYPGGDLRAVTVFDLDGSEEHHARYQIAGGQLKSVTATGKMKDGKKERHKWAYDYDKQGRLIKVVDSHGRKHGNSAGNTVTMTIDWTNPLPTVTPAATGSTLVKTYRRNPTTNRIEQIITGAP